MIDRPIPQYFVLSAFNVSSIMSNNLPLFDICGLVKAIKLIYLTINFISIELNFCNTEHYNISP